jgi:hypothetical protein
VQIVKASGFYYPISLGKMLNSLGVWNNLVEEVSVLFTSEAMGI